MDIHSDTGIHLRAYFEKSKTDSLDARSYYLSLSPAERILYAKDIFPNYLKGHKVSTTRTSGHKSYKFVTIIPTNHIDITEEAVLTVRTDKNKEIESFSVSAKLTERGSDVTSGYQHLGVIHPEPRIGDNPTITHRSGEYTHDLDSPEMSPILEVLDAAIIDLINEHSSLRSMIGNKALEAAEVEKV